MSRLGRFEYAFLDDDSKTNRIKEALRKGVHIFKGFPEAHTKYKHLILEGYKKSALATFEIHCIDAAGGTERIELILKNGVDVLEHWPYKEVQEKYGHLRALLPAEVTLFPSAPVARVSSLV